METEDALRASFETHYEGLFRVALLMTGSAQEAEDVVQESFLKVQDKLSSLPDKERRPYLRAVLVNELRERARRRFRLAARLPFLIPTRVDAMPYEDRDELWQLVLRLPARQRACVVLRFYEDLSLIEIAEILGCSIGTVKSQLHRVIEHVRKGRDDADRDELRDSLARAASSARPQTDSWKRMRDRQSRPGAPPPWSRLGAAILAAAVALGGFILVVRAFGATDSDDLGNTSPGAASLEETAWILTEIDGEHVTTERPMTLLFAGGEFGAESECNFSGGRYEIDAAALITAGGSTTTVACQGGEAVRERLLFEVLRSSPILELDGATLTLISETGTLGFVTDPCSLLTDAEVEAATGDMVVSSGLVPPERMRISGGPQLCLYEIPGAYASVVVHVVPATLDEFHSVRDRDPESSITIPVTGIGDEALIQGMASILVFQSDHYFGIAVQHGAGTPGVERILKGLARAAVAGQQPDPMRDQDPAPSLSAGSYLPPDERWAPPTHVEGDRVVMPVTFPDGTTAELVYPAPLGLDDLNVYADTFVDHGGSLACGPSVSVTRHDPHGGWIRDRAPVLEHVGRDGQIVGVWEGTRDNEPYDYIVYRIGSWSVLVGCVSGALHVDADDLAIWADHLMGRQTADGLLVLEGSGPLVLHPYRDTRSGPTLRFSDADVVIDLRVSDGCEPDSEHGDTNPADGVVQWCVQPDGGVYLYANAWNPVGKQFLQHLVDGLQIRDVTPPA